ncbi:MAG: DUF882 domain-containing protein [Gammaproteobacteria bacterium]|nr:DUF882 domain-containing protein [Gammaproteobacteria bacterium]
MVGADHWSKVKDWPGWCANFIPHELASKGPDSSAVWINSRALWLLQKLRDVRGPLHINSAYRTEAHNHNVGGAPQSKHRLGQALDIELRGADISELAAAARAVGFTGIGYYRTFIHVDIGPAREWDER